MAIPSIGASAAALDLARPQSPTPAEATLPAATNRATGSAAVDAGVAVDTAAAARQAGDAPPSAFSPEQVLQALDEVREAIAPVARNLLFSIDDDTGRTVIKVIDVSTDEVIKQIPSEEILAIAKALDKLQGLLIRQEA